MTTQTNSAIVPPPPGSSPGQQKGEDTFISIQAINEQVRHSSAWLGLLTGGHILLLSPFDGAASTGVIEEGRLARTIKSHDTYALIKEEKGRGGWIPNASFEPIAMTMANNIAGKPL